MKKLTIILSVIGLLLMSMPMNASAAATKQVYNSTVRYYGTLTVMESEGWEDKPGGGKFITQVAYVTETVGGYVYLDIVQTTNTKIDKILPSASFELISNEDTATGKRVLLKAKGNVSGKTELLTLTADIVDPSLRECKISYSPLGVSCITLEDKSGNTIYLDKNGNSITKEQYTEVCEGGTPTDPDVPDTPNTGNPIPYIAVGGGLLALAGVYFYSRKSNKMYKI